MRRFVLVAALALIGCGGGTGDPGGSGGTGGTGGTVHQPTLHAIANSQGEDIPAKNQVAIGPFTVPTGATVTYVLVDTPTGIGSDTMDIGVVSDSTVNSSSPVGYGVQQNVSSTNGTTPALPGGAYDVLVQCFNLIDDCIFQVTIDATY